MTQITLESISFTIDDYDEKINKNYENSYYYYTVKYDENLSEIYFEGNIKENDIILMKNKRHMYALGAYKKDEPYCCVQGKKYADDDISCEYLEIRDIVGVISVPLCKLI